MAMVVLLAAVRSAAPAADEQGGKLYREHCLECHGKAGRGDGPKAERLGFHPRDFALGSFKCRCTPSGALPSDDDLLRIVARGLPGSPMRGFGELLTEAEQRAVVEHVKSLAPGFGQATAHPCLEIPEPPRPTPESVAEGEQIYRALGCWRCHGPRGKGDGPSAGSLADDWGEPIRVFNFTTRGQFKCGGEPSDLYRTLHTGMSGSPMPSYTEAFLFARESVAGGAALEGGYEADEIDGFRRWAEGQPTRSDLAAMPPEGRKGLADRRTWALVAFLKSLVKR